MIFHPAGGNDFADYLRDESRRAGRADFLCFPTSEADVQEAVAFARARACALTPQGTRTGVTAGAVPEGGLIVNFSRMNRLCALRHNAGRFSLVVEPGVLLADIRELLATPGRLRETDWRDDSGDALAALDARPLMFTPDPTEITASIGGMAACNASGSCSFHYGPMRPHVLALRLVLAQGDTIAIRRGQSFARNGRFELTTDSGRRIQVSLPALRPSRASKCAAGYLIAPDMDLIDLFIGSEGTLGLITELELALLPSPASIVSAVVFLPDEPSALELVRRARGDLGPRPARPVAIEYFDRNALDLLRRQRQAGRFPEIPDLDPAAHTGIYLEYHGASETDADVFMEELCGLIAEAGGSEDDAWLADTPPERERLRIFRHAIPESVNDLIAERKRTHPTLTKLGTDMAVPDEQLEDVMAMYHGDLADSGLEYVIFGHIGNNHLHVNILPRDPDDYARGKALYEQWARRVSAWQGTVSAEHGIGKIKVPFLRLMFSDKELDGMRQVKHALDPDGLLNPGNLFEPKTPSPGRRGQGMVEMAIALPILLLLFVGMIYFHARSFNQARAVAAARHACWLGGQNKFDQIPQVMTNFFTTNSPSYKINVQHSFVDVPQPAIIKPLTVLLSTLGYKTDNNPKVTLQYTQSPFVMGVMMPPGMRTTNQNASLDFMWTNAPNTVITVLRTSQDSWSGDAPMATRIVLAAYVGFNI